MPYIPDWEPLPAAVKRIMASSVEESEAKANLCHAIADGKISVRVTLAGGKGAFSGGNVAPPAHLEPDDLDWDNSRPNAPWSIGPMPGQHYAWLDGWKKERFDRVEVSTADVLETLCTVPAQAPVPLGGNEFKRKAVNDAITEIGVFDLSDLSQKARETRIQEYVKEKSGLSVSDRYIRDLFKEQKEALRS
jgi:hypothetical protein